MKLFVEIVGLIAVGILIFMLLVIFVGSFMFAFEKKEDEAEEKFNSQNSF